MPRHSVSDILRFAQSPDASYRPIRAQIQASLHTDDEDDDEEMITDICMLICAIAHRRQQTWLTQMAGADAGAAREALDLLTHAQQLWAEEIAAVRHLSDSLAALGRQAGLTSARINALIDTKVRREFFQFP